MGARHTNYDVIDDDSIYAQSKGRSFKVYMRGQSA